MKSVLKWVRRVLLVVVLVPVLALLAVWGYYRSVVSAKPWKFGGLDEPQTPASKVDPFIATGGFPWMCGHDTPAATTPFGMVRLCADTSSIYFNENGNNRSGYFYGDNKIIGFSHTRLVGADALEGGIFRAFPTIESRVGSARKRDRATPFSHDSEGAEPGFYAVRLPKEHVLAELTATPRVGVHRYTFDGTERPHILLDATSALGGRNCEFGTVKILPDKNELEGMAREQGSFSGRYGGLNAYFVARFDKPFQSFGTWSDDAFTQGSLEVTGENVGADLTFDRPASGPFAVELRVAISYVSIANARLNLEAEAAQRSFGDIATAARDAWEKRLSVITVQGGTPREQEIFYTALYHAFVMPTIFTDVNGEYRGFDKEVHKAEGFQYYTDLSIWDTFRAVHPLYNLVARAEQRDMLVTLVEMVKAGGCLPRWPSGIGYTNCMMGTPADILVTEAYLKGVRDFDVERAYQAMRETGLTGKPEGTRFAGREGLEYYLQYGYCPSDKMDEGVACTLEFAWADHAISLLAKELGKEEDAKIFAQHAQFYKNVWNPNTLFFEGRDTAGNFQKERNPRVLTYVDFKEKYTKAYVEGSGWQWRWGVPYDPEGLISLFPSKEYFVQELETYFKRTQKSVGWWNPGGYYWHGNEPFFHAAYLFNSAGRPDLTQKWVRYVLENKYSDDYVGIDGNDDGGTMSAWYVLSALGFYPIAGTTRYEIGSPLFSEAVVRMGDKELRIVAENNSPKNVYVQSVSLNGKAIARTWFEHSEIAEGGTLAFVMGPEPAPRG